MLCLTELSEDVPMEGKGQWVHMDRVEYDKLEWLKDLPLPSADDTKVGQTLAFGHSSSCPCISLFALKIHRKLQTNQPDNFCVCQAVLIISAQYAPQAVFTTVM